MYFINDVALARKLKTNTLSELQQLWYYLVFVIIGVLLTSYTAIEFLAMPSSMWSYLSDATALLLTIVGTIWVFRTNVSGDNRQFIARCTCLGFPIGVQTLLLTIVVYGILYLAMGYDVEASATIVVMEDYIASVVLVIYFYARLNRAMRIASHDLPHEDNVVLGR